MAKSGAKGQPATDRPIWSRIRERWSSISDLRFNLGLLVVGILLVCWVPQGRDVVATISDAWAAQSSGAGQWWLFALAVAFLGLQIWLWSRLLIQLRHREKRDWRKDKLLVYLPRLLGIVPYLAAAAALARVPEGVHVWPQAGFFVFLAVLAYLLYWLRYRIFASVLSWDKARALFQNPVGRLKLTRFELGTLAVSLALSLLILIWLAFDPVTLPLAIGSAALAFLAFALIVPPVNLLIALVWRQRFPVLTALLLLAFAASFFNDNHRIRTLDEAPAPNGRPSLEQAYADWAAQAPRDPDDSNRVTAILVTAAGGASRAGFWTLAVLQRLDEAEPGFNRRIFTISAVSGSALGAVDYVAAIAADPGNDPRLRHRLTLDHAGADFLAPALGGMFYGDLVQRFIPFPLFNDRSWSIERGFEAAWADACDRHRLPAGCADLMDGPFLDLWRGPRAAWRPNLLLIGTVQEDGSRIATSNIDMVEFRNGLPPRPLLPNVYDYFRISGLQVAASTAVMNSARFPWISPPGRIGDSNGRNRAYLLDGGYFEASAADTSEDLAAALAAIQQRRCPTPSAQCPALRILFLTLLNGEVVLRRPVAPGGRAAAPAAGSFEVGRIIPVERLSPDWHGRPAAIDALGPIYGLFGTQISRGERALTRIARFESSDMPVPWAEVRLLPCRMDDERPLAMSWALSEPTRNRVRDQLATLRLQPRPAPQRDACRALLQSEMSHLADTLGIGRPPRP